MIREWSVFYVFFQNSFNIFVDKIPHSQSTTPYLGISKTWNIQLLLPNFVMMQRLRHYGVIFCYEMRKWDKNNTSYWRHMAYKNLVKKDEKSMKGVFSLTPRAPNSDIISNMQSYNLHIRIINYFLFESSP